MKFHCSPQNNVLGNIMAANFRNFVESLLKCEGWGVLVVCCFVVGFVWFCVGLVFFHKA